MRTVHTLLLVFGSAMFAPAVCLGQTKCPWINEATARGILGGPVTLAARVTPQGDGVCEFSRQQGAIVHQLRISVDSMTDIPKQFPTYVAQCPPNSSPVRAIGNAAVTCSLQGKGEASTERIVGRVRDHAFVVNLSSTVSNDPSMTPQMRRDKVNLVAEQVAGILF
jgi:hypothetical protein